MLDKRLERERQTKTGTEGDKQNQARGGRERVYVLCLGLYNNTVKN